MGSSWPITCFIHCAFIIHTMNPWPSLQQRPPDCSNSTFLPQTLLHGSHVSPFPVCLGPCYERTCGHLTFAGFNWLRFLWKDLIAMELSWKDVVYHCTCWCALLPLRDSSSRDRSEISVEWQDSSRPCRCRVTAWLCDTALLTASYSCWSRVSNNCPR